MPQTDSVLCHSGCQLVFRANLSAKILLRYNPRTMSLLWLPINIGQAVLAALWSLVCAVAAIVLSKVTRSPRPGLFIAKSVWSPLLLVLGGVRLDIHGLERIDPSRPYLVVANHQSWADIPVLFAALPMPILFVAKQELESLPLLRHYFQAVGMVFINRTDRNASRHSVSQLTDRLRTGWSVFSFPEGTRSIDGRLQRFRAATFAAALEAGAPVLPVALEGPARIVPRKGFRFRPGRVGVAIGEPIPTTGMDAESRVALSSQAQQVVAAELARLRGLSDPGQVIAPPVPLRPDASA